MLTIASPATLITSIALLLLPFDNAFGQEQCPFTQDRTIRKTDFTANGALAFLSDPADLVFADGKNIVVLDLAGGKSRTLGSPLPSDVLSLVVRGSLIAIGQQNADITVKQVPSGQTIASFKSAWSVSSLAMSRDGKLLASGYVKNDADTEVWDVDKKQRIAAINSRAYYILSVALSPINNNLVVTGLAPSLGQRNPNLLIRDLSTSRQTDKTLGVTDDWIQALDFSPTGDYLAVGAKSGAVYLLESNNRWRTYRELREHKGPIKALAFDPEGRFIAAGGDDNVLRVWETRSGQQVCALQSVSPCDPNGCFFKALAFSPDGKWLAAVKPTPGALGNVDVWRRK